MRLDRFLTLHSNHGRKDVRILLGAGKVAVNGEIQKDPHFDVQKFTKVAVDGETLQDREAVYLALHKPAGYLSATKDDLHPTVMELIPEQYHEDLHIAGRLDRASTGLLLLTNDSRWSWAITGPGNKIVKTYLVDLRDPVAANTKEVFSQGIYFAYEDITTQPIEIDIVGTHRVRVHLREGRYHQIKRMFHAVGNKVTSLHRESIGYIHLNNLSEGEFRTLCHNERNIVAF